MIESMTASEFVALQAEKKPSKTHRSSGLTLEKDWRQTVVEAAKLLGFKVYWTWNSLHSPPGFPDLVLLKDSRLIFAELKNEKGKTTKDQDGWLEALAVAGMEVYLWRPQDWEQVESTLKSTHGN